MEKNVIVVNHKRSTRCILTVNGMLFITRTILKPIDENNQRRLSIIYGRDTKSIAPLDEALGIDNLPFKISIELMLKIAYLSITLNSFMQTKKILFFNNEYKYNN